MRCGLQDELIRQALSRARTFLEQSDAFSLHLLAGLLAASPSSSASSSPPSGHAASPHGCASIMRDVWNWLIVRTDDRGTRVLPPPQLKLPDLETTMGRSGPPREGHEGPAQEAQGAAVAEDVEAAQGEAVERKSQAMDE